MNINYIAPGIHNVEVDRGKGEIKVKGDFDPVKIQKRIEKLCKKKIELVSPKVQIKESTTTQKIVVKETKEVVLTLTHVLKFDRYIDLQITIYATYLFNLPIYRTSRKYKMNHHWQQLKVNLQKSFCVFGVLNKFLGELIFRKIT